METVFYFLIWAVMIFLMMRMGCGKHVMGQDRARSSKSQPGNAGQDTDKDSLYWEPPAKDVDPVCGKTILTSQAKPSVYAGSVYYLCSHPCREAFEAAPDIYASDHPHPSPAKVEHHYG